MQVAPTGVARRQHSIGVMLATPRDDHFIPVIEDALRARGWTPGQDVRLIVCRADGTADGHARCAAELAAQGVDLLTTTSTPAAKALIQAARGTPVVFVNVFDPVAAGLVAEVERPGGRATGVAGFRGDIAGTWVAILKQAVPTLQRIVMVFEPTTAAPRVPFDRAAAEPAAARLGVTFDEVRIEDLESLDRQLGALAEAGVTGLLVVPHTFSFTHREQIVACVARHRLPAIYGVPEMVRCGGLMSYGPDICDQWREATWHMDRILRGDDPGILPVRFTSTVALAVNRSAAEGLGLVLPPALLGQVVELVD